MTKPIKKTSWKTTLFGIVTILPNVLSLINIHISPDAADAIHAVGGFLLGWSAKDKNVTGGTVQQ